MLDPLVLAIVFVYMAHAGISLQRISLGALIISLGLLVDDAMITIEMMVSQLEAGVDREHSATHAWVTTAFPMLTGTLVTVAGFVPIGLAKSGAGEYCYSLFIVITVALLASWVVAVLFAPVIDNGKTVPLSQVATIGYGIEQPVVWQRDLTPTITVQADVAPNVEAKTVNAELAPAIAALSKTLPAGDRIETGGSVEESAKGLASVAAVFPIMIFLMLTILMAQLHSFQKMLLAVSVAPLRLIGVVLALLPTGTPIGFVAILGVLALSGMIIRNSVILIDQIDVDIARGLQPWDAVIDSITHRMRPIALTAAAAILGMVPIAPEVFWGPMAYAIIGGLFVATLLTLLFLPALYVAWFRIKEPERGQGAALSEAARAVAV